MRGVLVLFGLTKSAFRICSLFFRNYLFYMSRLKQIQVIEAPYPSMDSCCAKSLRGSFTLLTHYQAHEHDPSVWKVFHLLFGCKRKQRNMDSQAFLKISPEESSTLETKIPYESSRNPCEKNL